MIRIRIAEDKDFNSDVLDYLKSFAEVVVESCSQEEIPKILKEFDVFWFRLGFRIGSDEINGNIRCQMIATPVTGIDHIDEELCQSRGISVVCLRGEFDFLKRIRATAELTMALTLDLMRQIGHARIDTLNGNWQRDMFRGEEIFEKKVGIVGMGRLGTIVASLFTAFGAEVFYSDVRHVAAVHYAKMSIEELISTCDIISIHVNYKKSNHHLFDSKLFARFTGKQFLINTSRGGLVDEAALIEALEHGKIKGAALDVVQNEHQWSNPNTLSLYAAKHKNLIITPHIGGSTYESFYKTEWFLAEKVKSMLHA